MLSRIRDLLFFPDRFFSQQDTEDVSLIYPAIIVGLSGLTSLVFFVLSIQISDPLMLVMISYSLVWMILMPFIGWAIYTILFYYLGRMVSGSGTPGRILQYSGYGTLPGTLLGFLSLYGSSVILHYPGVFPGTTDSSSLHSFWLIAVGSVILSFISLFWSGYIWAYGVAHAHKIPVRKSALIVTIIVILSVMVIIWPLILNELLMKMYSAG